MVEAARITSGFGVPIPKQVWQDAGMQVGQYLISVRSEDGWEIQRAVDDTVAALQLAGDNQELEKTLEEHHQEFEIGRDDDRG